MESKRYNRSSSLLPEMDLDFFFSPTQVVNIDDTTGILLSKNHKPGFFPHYNYNVVHNSCRTPPGLPLLGRFLKFCSFCKEKLPTGSSESAAAVSKWIQGRDSRRFLFFIHEWMLEQQSRVFRSHILTPQPAFSFLPQTSSWGNNNKETIIYDNNIST